MLWGGLLLASMMRGRVHRVLLFMVTFAIGCNVLFAQETIVDDRGVNNRHVAGEWVAEPEKQKSFQCCGWSRDDYKWNPGMCGNVSYEDEKRTHHYSGSTTGSTQAGASACDCDARGGHRTTVGIRDSYVWKPLLCNFKPFDGERFCKLLGDRTILMIGDSIVQQLASTIMSMVTAANGTCADQITLYRSDYLFFTQGYNSREFGIIVPELKPNITIISAGAHLDDIGDIKNTWYQLTPQFAKARAAVPGIQIAWVTQAPGHQHCMHFSTPQRYTTVTERPPRDAYGWYNFPHFDTYSANISKHLGVKLIDLSPLYYRIDGHPGHDCLHYCLPGPLDLFGILVYQMLDTGEL